MSSSTTVLSWDAEDTKQVPVMGFPIHLSIDQICYCLNCPLLFQLLHKVLIGFL